MPKLVVLASRHPASTVRVIIFWHHDVEMVPKLKVLAPRPANNERVVTFGSRQTLRIEMVLKLLVFNATMRPRSPTPRGSSLMHQNGAETTAGARHASAMVAGRYSRLPSLHDAIIRCYYTMLQRPPWSNPSLRQWSPGLERFSPVSTRGATSSYRSLWLMRAQNGKMLAACDSSASGS